jgi:cob(I)alamin adenosyltransferase
MRIYTRHGDDGTTGLLYGGRTPKDSAVIRANGSVDEAQAALGVVRAEVATGSELDEILVGLERDLYVLMAELATAPANRHKLTAGTTMVTPGMVERIEELIDALTERFPPVTEFVIPGHDRVSAALDVARTGVRRAERHVIGVAADGSSVGPYLNRLSDLVWTMARWQEHGESLLSRVRRETAAGETAAGETAAGETPREPDTWAAPAISEEPATFRRPTTSEPPDTTERLTGSS